MPRRTTTLLLSALATFSLSVVGLEAARADQVFIKATGQLQGAIGLWYNPTVELGGVSLSGYGLVEDLAWSVVSPRDAASGLPTGKRQHRPLSVRVRMSAATSLLGMALTHNENLPNVTVTWFARDPQTGEYAQSRSMLLTNANVSSFSLYSVREQGEVVTYAEFMFTYQRVGIEDFGTGVSYLDDWEAPIR